MNIRDIISLDNNEYVVVSKTLYNNKPYLYLVDINSPENFKFCLEKQNNEVEEVEDDETMQKLIPLFYEASRDLINKIENEN